MCATIFIASNHLNDRLEYVAVIRDIPPNLLRLLIQKLPGVAPLRSFQSSITIELKGTASFCGVHFERLDTADAKQIAEIYRKHWSIETAFQEMEAHLHSEINSLGYPKAALFGFCTALVAYNVLAVVKAAPRSQHGEEKIANDVSSYYLAGILHAYTKG